MNRHPSELSLLNLGKGLAVDDEIRRHVEECAECREQLSRLAGQESLFLTVNDPTRKTGELFAEYAAKRRAPRMLGRLIPVFATLGAAAVCLVILQPRDSDNVRLKGDTSVRVVAARGNVTFDVTDGSHMRKGDLVKVSVVSPNSGFLTVLSRESGRFEPLPPLTNVPIEAQTPFAMSGSLEVECEAATEELAVFIDEQPMKEVGEDGLPTGGHLFRLGMVCDDHE